MEINFTLYFKIYIFRCKFLLTIRIIQLINRSSNNSNNNVVIFLAIQYNLVNTKNLYRDEPKHLSTPFLLLKR